MNLQEAMKTHCFFKRPDWNFSYCWYSPDSGPFRHLVNCDYFVLDDNLCLTFSTTLDMYSENLLAEDFEIVGF